MDSNSYLEKKEVEYSLELTNHLLDGIKRLKLSKGQYLNDLVNELNILKEKISNYEEVIGSMVIYDIFNIKEDIHQRRERLSVIETNMGYFDWELSYISDIIYDFEELKDSLESKYEKIKIIEEYEEKRKANQEIFLIKESISQIKIEVAIIDNIGSELLKMNTFGIYDQENIAKSIQLDTNALLTDMLIKELERVSKIKIDNDDIEDVNVFGGRFSQFVLNNHVTESISKIEFVKKKLVSIKACLNKYLEKKEIVVDD